MIVVQDPSTPVLILRSDSHGGLNIMRSLGPLGIDVYDLDPNPSAPAFHSRYCRGKFIWDIEHAPSARSLDYLAGVSRSIGRRAILIATTDRTARFVADHDAALRQWFLFPRQRPELVHSLASKKEMYALAKEHKVPTAETAFPESPADVESFLRRAVFPIMLKAIDGQRLWERVGKKMFVVRSARELLEIYEAVEDKLSLNLMLQEYIPGADDTIWMFNGYFDERSDCLLGFTGRKLRQCPIHTGSTSLGICLANPAVESTTRRLMQAIRYRGILDIGYRYDARDGQYKVLDVNPRIGATFRLFVGANGMDVARALYLDLTGQPVPSSTPVEGRKWIVEDLDLVSSIRYWSEGTLTFRSWAASLRGIDETTFLSLDDPQPFFAMVVNRSRELLGRIFGRIRAWLAGSEGAARKLPALKAPVVSGEYVSAQDRSSEVGLIR